MLLQVWLLVALLALPLSMLVLVEKGELWLPRRVGVVLAGKGVVAHQFLVQ